MNELSQSSIIEKELIPQLQFSDFETLNTPKKRNLRSHHLHRATILGNLTKSKVQIYFKDCTNKLLQVNTTIWAVTTDFVVLKQGITIPKKSIIHIE